MGKKRKLHIICASITGCEDSLELIQTADRIQQYLCVDTKDLTSYQLFSPIDTLESPLTEEQSPPGLYGQFRETDAFEDHFTDHL